MHETEANLFSGMRIEPAYMMLNIEASTDLEAIEILAKNFLKAGAVKPSFIPAILQRERDFCTGLQFEAMGIAIPHTDAEHVNHPAIAIGRLAKPVEFKAMGMPEVSVEVKLLFMLAIQNPHQQIEFLQTLMNQFQEKNCLKELIACENKESLTEKFVSYFR